MSFEILNPMFYGREGKNFRLEKGDIVPKDFFLPADRNDCLKNEFIKKSKERPDKKPKGDEVPAIGDLAELTVAQAKEFLEAEPHVDILEKYLDQENAQEFPRVSITKFIERRIKELTGFE